MKDKILFMIIGILIGAIIATTGFFIYSKTTSSTNQPNMMQMNGDNKMGTPPSGDMSESPEKPDGEEGTEPPEMPNENNAQNGQMQKQDASSTEQSSTL